MKAFIDRIFNKRKQDDKQIKESITTETKATEAMVEAIIKEVKQEQVITYPKPNHFPDCNCNKCMRWKKQNA
jgi:ribosomal protein S25